MINHPEIYKQNSSFPIILRGFLPKVPTLQTALLYVALGLGGKLGRGTAT